MAQGSQGRRSSGKMHLPPLNQRKFLTKALTFHDGLRFGKKINSHMVIALHIALLVQAPEKSGWLPYLRMLPKKFDTMPVRYPQELFDLLPQNAQGIYHDGALERNQRNSLMMG